MYASINWNISTEALFFVQQPHHHSFVVAATTMTVQDGLLWCHDERHGKVYIVQHL